MSNDERERRERREGEDDEAQLRPRETGSTGGTVVPGPAAPPPASHPSSPPAPPGPYPPAPPAPSSVSRAWPPAPPSPGDTHAGPAPWPPPPAPPAPRVWGWRRALAGFVVAMSPQLLLSVLADTVDSGSTTTTPAIKVTVASAIALLVSSAVFYGWQLLAAWFFSLRTAGGGLRAWGFVRPPRAIVWLVPLALFAVYAITVVHDSVVNPHQQQIVTEFPKTAAGLALFTILAVVMAPLCEETFFRGFLFKGLEQSWGFGWAAVVSASVFSLAHLQLDIFVPLFALGFALAFLYRRTGSLWSSIALHAVFNLVSVLAWALT